MSKTDKLLEKLANGSISAAEARTLLGRLGWALAKSSGGSHEQWKKNGKVLTIATHTKELKRYQISQIAKALEE